MARTQIGTVRVMRTRIYPLDPALPPHVQGAEVIVQPGEYPVYEDGFTRYWRMTGVINHSTVRLGDGMLAMNPGDVLSEDDTIVYSRRYGPEEWANLLHSFTRTGMPPLVFTLKN